MKNVGKKAAERVVFELSCRGGFDNILDSVDEDTKQELTATLAEIINDEIEAARALLQETTQ